MKYGMDDLEMPSKKKKESEEISDEELFGDLEDSPEEMDDESEDMESEESESGFGSLSLDDLESEFSDDEEVVAKLEELKELLGMNDSEDMPEEDLEFEDEMPEGEEDDELLV